ncbi:MAG TPA: radical SAM/SPASM domain-containing protein [Flavitalea sp.]|nr:radical SAM/SPASM domain-containing protein [Flavitalea sp.]
MARFNLNDTINLLSKLTFRRTLNAGKVLTSFYISKWTGKPVQWGNPVSVSFEPTTSCNLRCPECPSGLRSFTRPTGMLENNFFKNTIDQISRELVYLVFYFQGEPYLNPQFLKMVAYASSRGIYTATSTNAHYLNDNNARQTVECGLDRLIISIDGTTQNVYQQYRRGGSLDKVIEGTKNIVAWKKKLKSRTPFIFFQFLVVKPNEHQVHEIKLLAKECGVDEVRFKTAQVYDYKNDPNNLIPVTRKFSRYIKEKNGVHRLKNALSNHCWRLWHATVITWDGMVVPCCFDKDAQHKLGDLKGKPFSEIWKNDSYKKFRTKVLHGRRNIDICANCSEGTRVWSE